MRYRRRPAARASREAAATGRMQTRAGIHVSTHTGSHTGIRTGGHASAASGGAAWRGYLLSHVHSLFHSLGRMARAPWTTLMTVAVIGIALALPAGLYVLLQNLQAAGAGWQHDARISLFLHRTLPLEEAAALAERLRGWPEVAAVTLVTPEAALEEFRRLSGFEAALEALGENPLPAVVVVQPRLEARDAARLQALLERLRQQAGVERAQLDLAWVQRLFALMEIGRRGVLVLGLLLSLAVLLVVGNTIRLAIENRREEIEVQKLVGATDGFIRRPFLYGGMLHGLAGAVLAWLLVQLAVLALAGPVRHLAVLYRSELTLQGLGAGVTLLLLACGALLGLAGAWLAVARHLREIEPA